MSKGAKLPAGGTEKRPRVWVPPVSKRPGLFVSQRSGHHVRHLKPSLHPRRIDFAEALSSGHQSSLARQRYLREREWSKLGGVPEKREAADAIG